jgi:alpha-D-xyloside xylohydrolase
MSGGAFWSHDIGGFSGTASAALYKRWVAFGLLSTHSRLHGDGSYRVPWIFDEESVAVMRHFARLKNRVFPYLFSAAHDAHTHGWPVMRSMFVEFPDDPACRYLDRQYMLGSSLLVAPVLRADDVAEYYVPVGQWTNLLNNELIEGGRWRSEKFDFMRVPLLVRENSIIPSGNEEQPQWRVNDELTLNLFQIADGAQLQIRVYPSDGEGAIEFRCARRGKSITLESDGRATNVKVALNGAKPIDWPDIRRRLTVEVRQ